MIPDRPARDNPVRLFRERKPEFNPLRRGSRAKGEVEVSLHALIRIEQPSEDRRRAPRRLLRLAVLGEGDQGEAGAIVRNLSETGLLLETESPLAVGEGLSVELPQAGKVAAEVIWMRAPFYGCEFVRPVSRAAVSAALLRSPIDEPAVELLTPPAEVWETPLNEAPLAPGKSNHFEAIVALILLAATLGMFTIALLTLRAG